MSLLHPRPALPTPVPEAATSTPHSRRAALLAALGGALAVAAPAAAFQRSTLAVAPLAVDPSLEPDVSMYNLDDFRWVKSLDELDGVREGVPGGVAEASRPRRGRRALQWPQTKRQPRLREASNAIQAALNAETLPAEEAAWSAVIETYEPLIGDASAPWLADVVGRAYGNRGNARNRMGQADAALVDLSRSAELCPYSPDPILNRGVVLENSGRFEEAAADYRAVLAAFPDDPSGAAEGWGAFMGRGWVGPAVGWAVARSAPASRTPAYAHTPPRPQLFSLEQPGQRVRPDGQVCGGGSVLCARHGPFLFVRIHCRQPRGSPVPVGPGF